MREKTARPKDIDRYIKFLQMVKQQGVDNTKENPVPFRKLIETYGVSKSIEFALKKLGAINIENEKTWTYEWGEPTKQHALQILDFLLSWRKQKEKQPTINFGPEFETIIDKLQSISLDLRNLLKTPENSQKQSDLVYIAGQIATAGYKVLFEKENWSDFEHTNDYIIKCTEDLITKLYKK